jgi:hypothetical protein
MIFLPRLPWYGLMIREWNGRSTIFHINLCFNNVCWCIHIHFRWWHSKVCYLRLFLVACELGCESTPACGPRCKTKRENTPTYACARLFLCAQSPLPNFCVPRWVSCWTKHPDSDAHLSSASALGLHWKRDKWLCRVSSSSVRLRDEDSH